MDVSSCELPPDLISFAFYEATQDADRVVQFLTAVGLEGTPESPRRLPAAFLMELGAALRLLAWESCGILIHREAGMPPAREAIVAAFNLGACLVQGQSRDDLELRNRVNGLLINRLAWHAHPALAADVVLDELKDDNVIEALAEFVWAHRNSKPT